MSEVQTSEFSKFLAEVKKAKGEQSILTGTQIPLFNSIPTGSFALDYALFGGVADGQAVMLYGVENSGKTTLAHKIVANAQRKRPWSKAVWIDTENTLDAGWSKALGVNLDSLHVSRPVKGEDAVDIIEAAMGAWETSVIVLDSVPTCVPYAIVDKSASDRTMGALAALMGILSSKVLMSWATEKARGHYVTIVLTNQFREKLGLVFGDPRTLPGGKQIRHLCMTMVELKNKEVYEKDQFQIETHFYNKQSFNLRKTKAGANNREGEFMMAVSPETGTPPGTFDDVNAVAAYAKAMGFVIGAGSHWRLDNRDEKFGSKADLQAWLMKDEAEMLCLKQRILARARVSKGLTPLPPDGYLLNANARENIADDYPQFFPQSAA